MWKIHSTLQSWYRLAGLCTVKAVQATRFAYCKTSIANRCVYCKISTARQVYVLLKQYRPKFASCKTSTANRFVSVKAIQPDRFMYCKSSTGPSSHTVKAGLHTVNTVQPNMFTYWHTAKAVKATRFAYCKICTGQWVCTP